MYGEATFSHYDTLLWLTGLKNTLSMFALSSLLGCLLGTAFGLIRYYQVAVLAPVVFTLGEVLKNSPVIVQLFLVYFGVPMYFEVILTPFEAAAIVLSANTTAFIAVICVSSLESVDQAQVATARTFAMKETDILNDAKKKLAKATGVELDVTHIDYAIGQGRIVDAVAQFAGTKNPEPYAVEIKTHLTPAKVGLVAEQLKAAPFKGLLVTDYVNPNVAERLKAMDIAFND